MRRLRIQCTKDSLLTIERSPRWQKRMVYILVANKAYEYHSGRRSRIIYIGTTGKGAHRPAASAVDKASDAFRDLRGVRQIGVHIASCRGRKAMRTWEHLESALLATFRELHFDLPIYNKRKGSVKRAEEIRYFRLEALRDVILRFAG